MAELIQKNDSLNTGREKLNEAIKDSNKAKVDAEQALNVANQSLAQSENTQEQLNQIVVEGDSSVEAAQARVDAENNTYPTLKARLDSKETEFSSQLAQTMLNVKIFGAKGDGITNDTIALQTALNEAGLKKQKCFIPSGVYMVNATLVVPTNVELLGDGIGSSILKAMPGTDFNNYSPFEWDGMSVWYRYKPLIRTAEQSKNIKISKLTIDFNNLVTGARSPAPLLIGHTKNALISEIEVINAMEPNYDTESDYGDRNRGCAILFAKARHCRVEKSVFGSSEYESISIRFGSEYIDIEDNVVYAITNTAHAIQTAIPYATGLPKTRHVKIINNTFYIKHAQDAIACHHSEDIDIEGNRIVLMENPNIRTRAGIRMVDNVNNIRIRNNTLDMTSWNHERPLSAIVLDEASTPANAPKTNITVSGNTAKMNFIDGVNYPNAEEMAKRPIIGSTIGNSVEGVTIADNRIELINLPEVPLVIIGVNITNFKITDNELFIQAGGHDDFGNAGSKFIDIKGTRRGVVSGNSIAGGGSGRISYGVYIEEGVTQTVVSENLLQHRVSNTAILNKSADIKVVNNIGIGLRSFNGALIRKTTNQTIEGNGLSQIVDFDHINYDHLNMVDGSRFVIPFGVKRVKLTASVRWDVESTGSVGLLIRKNGLSESGAPSDFRLASETTRVNITSAPLSVTEGDYFEVRAIRSGSDLDIVGGEETWFSIEVIE